MEAEKQFPQNKITWLETYFLITEEIILVLSKMKKYKNTEIVQTQENHGRFAIVQLAIDWTEAFEKKYEGVKWGEDEDSPDYYEAIEAFVKEKNVTY